MYYITQRGALMALQKQFREHCAQRYFHEGVHHLRSLLQHLYRAYTTRQRGHPVLDGRLSLLRVMTISK
jgi:hypothetical protein